MIEIKQINVYLKSLFFSGKNLFKSVPLKVKYRIYFYDEYMTVEDLLTL